MFGNFCWYVVVEIVEDGCGEVDVVVDVVFDWW